MNTEAKVGAFVIVSVLVLGAVLYFVRTTQTVRGHVPYTTHLGYAGGLEPGADVLFGGIKVGQVASVRPWPDDPTRIEVLFQVRSGTPVNQKSTARVGTVSVMSSPVLQITTGSNEATRLSAGDVVQSEDTMSLEDLTRTVAQSANILITELRSDIPGLTNEVRAVVANLNEITGPTTQKNIEAIVAQVNTLLSQEAPKIAQMTDQLSLLAKHTDEVMVSAKPLVSNVDRTITNVDDTVDVIRAGLTRDLAELERTIQDAGALLVSVQRIVGTNDEDIAEIVRSLRATSENFRALSDSLKQHPWNLIRTTQPDDRKVPQ